MREETRYRVTGSLLLLALAVICLPMLLDGAGLPAKHLPDLTISDTLPDPEPLPARPPESDFVARVAELREQVDEDGFMTDSGTRFGEPVLTPAPVLTPVPVLTTASDRRSAPPDTETAEAAPVPVRTADTTGAWAVQVASFAHPGNAEEFRARLREDGYEAFISTARSNDRVLRRVAVGPLLDRQRAERLESELSARYDVQARLMAFSN